MSSTVQIKEIKAPIMVNQAEELTSIFTEAFGQQPSDSFLERLNEKKDLSVLLAYEGGELVGFKIGYTRFRSVFFSWLGAVIISARRKGVARQLLQRQHGLCQQRGYTEIQTEAFGNNQAMLILNLQEGFEVSGLHLGHEDKLTVQLRKKL